MCELNQFYNKRTNMVRIGVIAGLAMAASAAEWMHALGPLDGGIRVRRRNPYTLHGMGPLEPRQHRRARMGKLSAIGGMNYGIRDSVGEYDGHGNGGVYGEIYDLGEAAQLKQLKAGYGGYGARTGKVLHRYSGQRHYGRGKEYDRLNGFTDRATV